MAAPYGYARKSYYEILNVSPSDPIEAIRASFNELAAFYYSDNPAGDPVAYEMHQAVTEAYQVLSDDSRRREYDMSLFADRYDAQQGHDNDNEYLNGWNPNFYGQDQAPIPQTPVLNQTYQAQPANGYSYQTPSSELANERYPEPFMQYQADEYGHQEAPMPQSAMPTPRFSDDESDNGDDFASDSDAEGAANTKWTFETYYGPDYKEKAKLRRMRARVESTKTSWKEAARKHDLAKVNHQYAEPGVDKDAAAARVQAKKELRDDYARLKQAREAKLKKHALRAKLVLAERKEKDRKVKAAEKASERINKERSKLQKKGGLVSKPVAPRGKLSRAAKKTAHYINDHGSEDEFVGDAFWRMD